MYSVGYWGSGGDFSSLKVSISLVTSCPSLRILVIVVVSSLSSAS